MKKTQPSLAKAIEEYSPENLAVLERWNAERVRTSYTAVRAEREAQAFRDEQVRRVALVSHPDVRQKREQRVLFKRWKELAGEVLRDRRHTERRARLDKMIIPGDPGGWTAS